MPPSAVAARTSDFMLRTLMGAEFFDANKKSLGNFIFVTGESFRGCEIRYFQPPDDAKQLGRTCTNTNKYKRICSGGGAEICTDECPHEYPHMKAYRISAVDKLWTVWIIRRKSAILQGFCWGKLWITLWTLWMNRVFGCA